VSTPSVRGTRLPGRGGHLGQHAGGGSPAALSVALVGAGRRGLTGYLPALQSHGSLRLAAVVETPARIAELGDLPGLAVPMYESIEACVEAGKPDLAIVATPHDCHVPLTSLLLKAGIPTLLEKPPARTCGEFKTLVKTSEECGTPLATALPFHYQDRYREFIRSLRSPLLTDAKVIVAAQVPRWPGIDNWRLSRERAGGGVLIDLGYHYIELILHCLGRPDSSSVRLEVAGAPGDEVEDEANLSLRFEARRVDITIKLRSGIDVERRNELAIFKKEHAVGTNSGFTVFEKNGTASNPAPPAASGIIAQISSLLREGFLAGSGSWPRVLRAQIKVLTLLDELYANASPVGRIPERIRV
jgi:predicted dehydrogenase